MGSVLYIDPSYTGTGLFAIDTKARKLEFDLIDPQRETMRTYWNYFQTGQKVLQGLDTYLRTHEIVAVKLEVPPPFGHTAAGLTGLGFLLLDRILRTPGIESVDLINPSHISNMQKRFFSNKTSRSAIAHEFLWGQTLNGDGEQGLTSVINADLLKDNDVATAYLFYIFEKILASEGKAYTRVFTANSDSDTLASRTPRQTHSADTKSHAEATDSSPRKSRTRK